MSASDFIALMCEKIAANEDLARRLLLLLRFYPLQAPDHLEDCLRDQKKRSRFTVADHNCH